MSFAPYLGADYGLPQMSSAEIMEGPQYADPPRRDLLGRGSAGARRGGQRRERRATAHHVRQEERFIVDRGMLLVRRGRERIHVGPGEDVRIPAKVRHTFEAEVDSTYTVEFRPALRVEEFSVTCFASH